MVKIVQKITPETTSVDYHVPGVRKIKMSNNLSTLDVVGQLGDNDMVSALRIANIGSNVVELSPSCFMGCVNLAQVSSTERCQFLEDYAFAGCSSLTKINCIQPGSAYPVKKIGTRCFYGCGKLDEVELNLAGNADNLYEILGDECFANCTGIRDVRWTNSAYASPRMLSGCSELTGIHLANKAGYLYPYAFAGLESLGSVTIPNRTWIVNDGLFENCPNLSSVEFEDGDSENTSAMVELFGDAVFKDCPSLHEVTIPRSITSFSQLGENMLAGSSISAVRFNGISPEFFGPQQVVKQFTWDTGKWYVGNGKDSYTTALKIAKQAWSNRIPIVVSVTEAPSGACSNCKAWLDMLPPNSKLGPDYLYIKAYTTIWWTSFRNWLTERYSAIGGDELPDLVLLWNKSGGAVKKHFPKANKDSKVNTQAKFASQVSAAFSGYVPPQESVHTLTETSEITLLGRNLYEETPVSCIYYASDGSSKIVKPNGQVVFTPEVVVDDYSTVNFKAGVWYYNARELREFADRFHIPVLIEYSSKGCTPCEYWRKYTYKSPEFQQWVRNQDFLFCRVEKKTASETWDDSEKYPQLNYVEYQWVKAREAGFPYPPIFCWYWNKDDRTIVHDISSYHFDQGVGSEPPWTLDEFYALTEQKFGSYTQPQSLAPGLSAPVISEATKTGGSVPVYRRYDNQYVENLPLKAELTAYNWKYLSDCSEASSFLCAYIRDYNSGKDPEDQIGVAEASALVSANVYLGEIDPNGVFFPCERKERLQTVGTCFKLDIGGQDTPVCPTVGKTASIPDGTYQVFNSSVPYRYDQTSYIFRVRDGVFEYVYRGTNYINDTAQEVQTGYPKNQWLQFTEPDSVDRFFEQIEGEDCLAAIVLANKADSLSALDTAAFGGFVQGSGVMWMKTVMSKSSEMTTPGTVAERVSKYLSRAFIGGFGPDTGVPCIYLYRACSSCSIGDPVVNVHTATTIKGKGDQQIIDFVKAQIANPEQ